MAPNCQGDDSIGQHVETLLHSRVDVEVGMLVGRQGSRDSILLMLPTPQQGTAAPAVLQAVDDKSNKKQKKTQPDVQVQLDVDAVVEHATQMAAMLPGGLAAMGLYLYSPEAAFANATSQLCKGLDGVASSPGAAADKLLFISSQTRKFLCKHRPAGTPSSATLAVCEFKLAPSLSSFSVLSCRYHTTITLPVLDSMQALSTHLESAITAESERIQNSIGSIQGSIASSTTTIGDLQQPSEVELLCPPACCDTAETSNSKEASVSGRIVLEGVLHGRAMVHKKDSVAAAVDMLKADLVASLHAKLDILMAEAEEMAGGSDTGGVRPALLKPASQSSTDLTLPLPTRVFFPVQDVLSFCDYLASGESSTDVSNRLQALLGAKAELSQIEAPEGKGGLTPMKQWNPCPIHAKAQPWLPCNITTAFAASALFAVAAAAVAFYPSH